VNVIGLEQGVVAIVFSFGLKMKALYSSELFVLHMRLHCLENIKSDGSC
jgi:hypothetical protein